MDKQESDFMLSFAEKTDGVNRRVTRVLIAMAIVLAVVVVAFCVRDVTISNQYFASAQKIKMLM